METKVGQPLAAPPSPTSTSVEVLRWTPNRPGRYGGYHRARQIEELLEQLGMKVRDLNPYPHEFKERLPNYLAGLSYLRQSRNRNPKSARTLWAIGYEKRVFQNYFKTENAPLLLAEFTGKTAPVHCGKPSTMKVIAIPQNLESLYGLSGRVERGDLENLGLETSALAAADAVFCISYEERWFLELLGIKADVIPYYPPTEIVTRMRAIRSLRKSTSKSGILMLGSAFNPDTAAGMNTLIEWFSKPPVVSLELVGNGTEKLKIPPSATGVKALGLVSNDTLDELLGKTRAVIIHQPAGTGMLTRIPELLIAGVPVFTNDAGARSCRHLAGLRIYEDREELLELLGDGIPDLTPEPVRPVAAEQRFKECVTRLTSTANSE